LIFVLRLIVGIVLLAIASKQDIKTREVSDRIWKTMFLLAAILLVIEINLFKGYERETVILEIFFMSMLMLMGYVLFAGFNRLQQGAFGGADAKAFMCIAVLLPYPLVFGMLPLSFLTIIWGELFAFAFYFPKALKVPREQWKEITFPLIPFLLIGLLMSALIYYIEQSMVI